MTAPTTPRTVTVLYFAALADAVGTGEEHVDLPDGVSTVQDLLEQLCLDSEVHRAAFADLSRVRVAVDQVYGALETLVAPGAEVAFFPPVTGG